MTNYVVRWRRPGCAAAALYLLVATITSITVYGMVAVVGRQRLSGWWLPLLDVVAFVGLLQLHKLVSRRRVPICPHCGVETNPNFRVCRACGRSK